MGLGLRDQVCLPAQPPCMRTVLSERPGRLPAPVLLLPNGKHVSQVTVLQADPCSQEMTNGLVFYHMYRPLQRRGFEKIPVLEGLPAFPQRGNLDWRPLRDILPVPDPAPLPLPSFPPGCALGVASLPGTHDTNNCQAVT